MSSYIDHGDNRRNNPVDHDWREHTWLNLAWRHGYERAYVIVGGNDPATQVDLAKWNALGRKAAA